MSAATVASAAAPAEAADRRARELSDAERGAVNAVGTAVAGLGLIGFVNSFAAVATAARPSFGPLAPTVPLGIDLGIAIFAALDIVLARLDMRPRWVRLVPWSLTAATIYLNMAGQHAWFGRVAHALLPVLWVAAVETAAHVARVRAGIAAGTAMDRIRASRWLLAPVRTVRVFRRMVLWEIRSYPDALAREQARLLTLTGLQDAHGPLAWRWRAPRRARVEYRIGTLAPAPPAAPLGALADRTRAVPAPVRTRTRAAVSDESAEAYFASALADGLVPSMRRIKAELHVGQDRAARIHRHLATVAAPHEHGLGRTA